MDAAELQRRIDRERHEAQEAQYERDHRERNAVRGDVDFVADRLEELARWVAGGGHARREELQGLADRLRGTLEVIDGEWLKAPSHFVKAPT